MAAPVLTAGNFFDAPTFGIDWQGKYVLLGRAAGLRKDNAGRSVSLPAGAIGYVASATPASILVVFGSDLRKAPEPTDHVNTVASRRYSAVFTFQFRDWVGLKLMRTR